MTTRLPLSQNKAFCALPWLHLAVFPEGSVKLCCVADTPVATGNDSLSVESDPIEAVWNSDYLRGVRRNMHAGKRIAECAHCYTLEKAGAVSRRLLSNARWANELGPLLDELIASSQQRDFHVPGAPLYYQLMPGNLCNLKCRMCSPLFSSQIERDPVHSTWTPASLTSPTADWTTGRLDLAPRAPRGVRLNGFHALEKPTGAPPFRWTNGAATITITPPPGIRPESVRVCLGHLRRWGQKVRVLVNGVAVHDGSLWWRGLDRTFPVPRTDSGELTVRLESSTFRAAGDPRELGVAVRAVELTHTVAEATPAPKPGGWNLREVPPPETGGGRGGNLREVPPPKTGRLPVGPWYRDSDWVREVLLQNADELRALYFTGGEPMLEKQVESILEHLIERGAADHIDIELNSNCTALREPVVEKLQHFRSVTVGLSVDARGPEYEYIRYPARWETVRRNVDRLLAMTGPRFRLVGGVVLQVYNALNVTRILEFFDERLIPFTIEVATTPSFLAIEVLPKRVREVAAARLDEYAAARCRSEHRDIIRSLSPRLRSCADRSTPENLRTLMLFSNDLDATRAQSARQVHGELLALLREDGFHWTDERSLARAA